MTRATSSRRFVRWRDNVVGAVGVVDVGGGLGGYDQGRGEQLAAPTGIQMRSGEGSNWPPSP